MNESHFKIFDLNIDKQQFVKDARRINKKVLKEYEHIDVEDSYPTYQEYQKILHEQLMGSPMSTKLHDYYNVFTFQYASIYNLYKECTQCFKEICEYSDQYMYWVHGWLNYQQPGESIPWHYHWKKLANMDYCYIGTYYVNAEPSITSYKFDNGFEIDRHNRDGTFVIYEDIGDVHMVEPWRGTDPRISITMEFVPMQNLQISPFPLNTWMPVV